MTIKELIRAVTALGFTEELESKDAFLHSLERALDVLFCDRVALRTVRYVRPSPTLCMHIESYGHECGESEAYKLPGKAYSFTTHGRGNYTVYTGGKLERVSFSGTTHHRRLVEGDYVTLVFYGENAFLVEDIAVYSNKLSDNPGDVPLFSELTTLNLRREFSDFYSLWGPVRTDTGKELFLECTDDKITLPGPAPVAINVTYRRCAPSIKNLSEESELDLPKGCEGLLPFLCAALYFLDDEPERAQYYMAIYKDMLSGTVINGTTRGYEKYQTDGWA